MENRSLQLVLRWVLASVATWSVSWWCLAPTDCQRHAACAQEMQKLPGRHYLISMTALLAMAFYELCGLVATYFDSKHVQALIPHIKSRCLPSFLLTLIFSHLALVEWLFSRSAWHVAHVGADGLRPSLTLRYVEWTFDVPIMFVLCGYCCLGRPLKEVSKPLMVTNFYIILSWVASLTPNAWMKWSMILVAFSLYVWVAQMTGVWTRRFEEDAPLELPCRELRPLLCYGLNLEFFLYGVIYLLAAGHLIGSDTERLCYFCLNLGSKLALAAVFVTLRAKEYHMTLTEVLKKVSVSNLGMISILRSSFDMILPCVLDTLGCCKLPQQTSGDMQKLEHMLGCPVAGANLLDFLPAKEDQANFSAYIRNVLRQADAEASCAALKTCGTWDGGTVPMAQVLHTKIQGSGPTFQATLHLSVVPRSRFGGREGRHLVCALTLGTTSVDEKDETEGKLHFDAFDERQTSETPSTAATSEDAASRSGRLVASLKDLKALGASSVLGVPEADEEGSVWADSAWGLSDHDGPMPQPAVAQDARIVGVWEGVVSQELGAYHQRLEFKNDCVTASVTVLNRQMPAEVRMNCSVEPCELDIVVFPERSSCPPPAIPYIFKIEDGQLHLCGPSGSAMRRAKAFTGPGLCIMERVSHERPVPRAACALEPLPEPEQPTVKAVTGTSGQTPRAIDWPPARRGSVRSGRVGLAVLCTTLGVAGALLAAKKR